MDKCPWCGAKAGSPHERTCPDHPDHIGAFRKNWKVPCQVCECKPTVGDSRLCGPCYFGEADTVGGNW